MPKTASDELFQLIKSLSKNEKRYFRLFVSRQSESSTKKFVKLFDAIDKQKEYNEAVILVREKSLKAQQLSNLKAHLHKQILQSLKLCNSSQIIDMQIRELIDHSQILYNKCLYRQCLKVLDKAKKMATVNDRSILLLDILEMEKQLVGQTVEKNKQDILFTDRHSP